MLSLLCAAELLDTVQFSEELWTFLNRRNIRASIWHLMAQSYNWQVMSRCQDSSSYFIIFHHLLSHTCNDIHPHLKVFWFSFQLVILIWKQDFQWSCKDWSVRKHPQKNFKKHFYVCLSMWCLQLHDCIFTSTFLRPDLAHGTHRVCSQLHELFCCCGVGVHLVVEIKSPWKFTLFTAGVWFYQGFAVIQITKKKMPSKPINTPDPPWSLLILEWILKTPWPGTL